VHYSLLTSGPFIIHHARRDVDRGGGGLSPDSSRLSRRRARFGQAEESARSRLRRAIHPTRREALHSDSLSAVAHVRQVSWRRLA